MFLFYHKVRMYGCLFFLTFILWFQILFSALYNCTLNIADFMLLVGQNKQLSLFSDVLLTKRLISNRTINVVPFTMVLSSFNRVNMMLFCNGDFHTGDK